MPVVLRWGQGHLFLPPSNVDREGRNRSGRILQFIPNHTRGNNVKLLPKYEGLEIIQNTAGGGHLYYAEPYCPCGKCYYCGKGWKCRGVSSVTSYSGNYGGGGLYPAGYSHALDAVFGAYTDKKAKDAVKEGGWMLDSYNQHPPTLDDLLVYRQEVEEMPTPGTISRDFGIGVHKAVDSLLKGEGEVPTKYATAVGKIMDWLERGGPDGPYTVEDTEVNIFHPELMYGGQIDCVARSGNRVAIIDWKSGKDIWPSHQMQLGGYCLAYEELTGLAVSELWVVKSNNSSFEAVRVKDIDAAKHAFLSVRQLKVDVEALEWL